MVYEGFSKHMSEDKKPASQKEDATDKSLSPGEKKALEYAKRILTGESKESVLQGLSESFVNGIEDKLAELTEENDNGIPPQYRGLNSEVLNEIWTIPEYADRDKTKQLKEKKEGIIAALQRKELFRKRADERRAADEQKIAELRGRLGIKEKESHEDLSASAQQEISPNGGIDLLNTEERKNLSGWSASYELAKVAKRQGLDLSTLSREEYANYAIQNFLAIDDSQLRMSPWQRMCESPEEIIAVSKEKKALINEETDKAFNAFCFDMKNKANEDDRFIQDGIRVRQGTRDSNSWLFFKINNGAIVESKETFKAYVSVKDLNTLTPERFIALMAALRDAGYNGDIKIFQDLVGQGVNLGDQIVMHGASENDAKLALNVAEKFFGDDLDQKSFGKDEMINGKKYSYSEVLAKKVKDAINP